MTLLAVAWEAEVPPEFGGGRDWVVGRDSHQQCLDEKDAAIAAAAADVARAEARATAWRRAHDALVEAVRADNDDVRGEG